MIVITLIHENCGDETIAVRTPFFLSAEKNLDAKDTQRDLVSVHQRQLCVT